VSEFLFCQREGQQQMKRGAAVHERQHSVTGLLFFEFTACAGVNGFKMELLKEYPQNTNSKKNKQFIQGRNGF